MLKSRSCRHWAHDLLGEQKLAILAVSVVVFVRIELFTTEEHSRRSTAQMDRPLGSMVPAETSNEEVPSQVSI